MHQLAGAINSWYAKQPRKYTPDIHKVASTYKPRVLACIDGGNAPIADTPLFAASLNRLHCSVFRGPARHEPGTIHTRFISLMINKKFTTYPIYGTPPDNTLLDAAATDYAKDDTHCIHSMPRVVGEWCVARDIIPHLKPGTCIVMDGSLAVWGPARRKFASDIMYKARRSGMILCGLSKTSRKLASGGRPLTDIMMEEASGNISYMDAGENGNFHTICIMLHAQSRWAYRLDIDGQIYHDMGRECVGSVVASLAANASDSFMPGYPYGLLDADRRARVGKAEMVMATSMLRALLDGGPRRMLSLNTQHEYLNRVAG